MKEKRIAKHVQDLVGKAGQLIKGIKTLLKQDTQPRFLEKKDE